MYSLLVLEAKNLKSRCQEGHAQSEDSMEDSFLASSSFWQFLAILVYSWLIDASLQSLSSLSHHFPLHFSVSPLLIKVNSLDLGPTQLIQDDLTSKSLIVSAKTLFPNKIIVTGTGGEDSDTFWESHYSIHYVIQLKEVSLLI